MRNKESSASLVSLDEVCETPELIWTAEMQMELRTAVAALLGGQGAARSSPQERARGLEGSAFFFVPSMAEDFKVSYRQLDEEIYVGNVYIRLFMKQPTFRLSNPIFFLERLVELWEHSFNKQVPVANSSISKEPIGTKTTHTYGFYLSDQNLLSSPCIVLCKSLPKHFIREPESAYLILALVVF